MKKYEGYDIDELDFSIEIIQSKRIECKCPRCEDIYLRRMKWSGNGMPRKICERCRLNTANSPKPHITTVVLYEFEIK